MEAAPGTEIGFGPEAETGLLLVESWVTMVRIKLGIGPFNPPHSIVVI